MSVVVFMSQGTGLADWDRQGILERESMTYRLMAKEAPVSLYTAETAVHHRIAEALRPAGVLLRPAWCPKLLYYFLGPLLHWRVMRRCREMRCHNSRGILPSIPARLLWHRRYIVRFGYIWSWDMARRGVHGWKLWIVLLLEWIACRLADRVEVQTEAQAGYLHHVHGVT